jgi:hypothetical protein
MKTKFLALFAAVLCCTLRTATADISDNLTKQLELLCSDVNSAKVAVINKIMKLSEAEAGKFWPIYHEYQLDLTKQAFNRADFISDFIQAQEGGTFDNEKAAKMAERWFDGEHARLDLLQKYHRKVKEVLTPVQAAQFLQIEHQIAILIDVTIAQEMPRVSEPKK